jgi:hypothetical protein
MVAMPKVALSIHFIHPEHLRAARWRGFDTVMTNSLSH